MRTRAAIMMACTGLLLATGCGGPNYVTNRRHLPQESCPDAESLPACEARIDGLSAALADALAPSSAPAQGQSVQQSAPSIDEELAAEAPARESDEESGAPSEDKDHKGGPDCASARDLRDRICDLSDAICALAARDGAPPEIMDRCTAARTSCERARSEVGNACPR